MLRRSSILCSTLLIVLALAKLPGPVPAASAASEKFAFGVIVDSTDPRSMHAAREAGFTHAKMILHWPAVEPSPGNYIWNSTKENDLDNIMKPARNESMLLVLRVDGVPDWAGGTPANADLEAVRRFYENAARHGAGIVAAYEILNEPNLPDARLGWGGPPSPAGYTDFLKAAYQGIKAGDPNALVLGGGVAPHTGGLGGTMEDTDFLNGMYDAGVKGSMDALSVHNYGGNTEPEREPAECGSPAICFRRAEIYRELMVQRGDQDTPIWSTEWGYLMDPGRYLGQYDWMKVSAEQQADYVVRAHRYAAQHWDWMAGMLLSNLDASTTPYHAGPEDGLPWFAILNPDYSPRPAWHALQSIRAEAVAKRAPSRRTARGQTRSTTEQRTSEVVAAPSPHEPTPALAAQTSAAPSPTSPARLRVTGTGGEGVNLRAAPSLSAARIKTLAEGSSLTSSDAPQESEGRGWRKVQEPGGAEGWVAEEFLAQP